MRGTFGSESSVRLLKEMYENLDSKEVMDRAVKMLNSEDFKTFKTSLFKKLDMVIDDVSMNIIKYYLKICNSIYNHTNYNTGLTDSEYDLLVSHYNMVTGKDIITESELSKDNTSNHSYKSLRGTIDKIYKITDEDIIKNKSQSTIEDWINRIQNRYFDITGKNINLLEEEVYVMPKFDGVSCIFECDGNGNVIKALIRGDTEII